MNVILKDLNTYSNKIESYYILKVIKKVPSKNFAILIMNNKKAKKL